MIITRCVIVQKSAVLIGIDVQHTFAHTNENESAKELRTMHDFKFLPLSKWDLRSSVMLRSVEWYISRRFGIFFLDCLTLEDGKDRLSHYVGLYQRTLRKITEERRSQLRTSS
jgi:hypothetical protein